ncbi:hypothetical protein ABKV19_026950 [Rosa sericea]
MSVQNPNQKNLDPTMNTPRFATPTISEVFVPDPPTGISGSAPMKFWTPPDSPERPVREETVRSERFGLIRKWLNCFTFVEYTEKRVTDALVAEQASKPSKAKKSSNHGDAATSSKAGASENVVGRGHQ